MNELSLLAAIAFNKSLRWDANTLVIPDNAVAIIRCTDSASKTWVGAGGGVRLDPRDDEDRCGDLERCLRGLLDLDLLELRRSVVFLVELLVACESTSGLILPDDGENTSPTIDCTGLVIVTIRSGWRPDWCCWLRWLVF